MILKILAVIMAWCLEMYFLSMKAFCLHMHLGAKEIGCGTYCQGAICRWSCFHMWLPISNAEHRLASDVVSSYCREV